MRPDWSDAHLNLSIALSRKGVTAGFVATEPAVSPLRLRAMARFRCASAQLGRALSASRKRRGSARPVLQLLERQPEILLGLRIVAARQAGAKGFRGTFIVAFVVESVPDIELIAGEIRVEAGGFLALRRGAAGSPLERRAMASREWSVGSSGRKRMASR